MTIYRTLETDGVPAPSDMELEAMDREAWAHRYWEKVDVRGKDDCWLWQASQRNGYGQFRLNGNTAYAHRLAWELKNGPIPEGLWICHTCDTPSCCNPAHLFLGTDAENHHDMQKKGRIARGIRHGGASLTQESVRQIRDLYAGGEYTQQELAQRFGTAQTNVSHIVLKQTWAWLK